MSKELEALEHIYYGSQGYGETDRYYKFLKQYIESIDNANPSEALKKLEMLSDCAEAMKEAPSSNWIEYANNETELDYQLWRAYEDLKQSLLKAEKEHKALEIIKEKNVSVAMLKSCVTVEMYNTIAFDEEHFKGKDYARKLAKEEFGLIKKVLE